MIIYLNNWTYFVICSAAYIIILIISLKVCGFFGFVNSLSLVKNISGKINNTNFSAGIKNFYKSYILKILLLINEYVFIPVIHFLAKVFFTFSGMLNSASMIIEKQISDHLKEVLELLCLLTRKSVNAEYKSVWPGILAAIVLIYIILTNV